MRWLLLLGECSIYIFRLTVEDVANLKFCSILCSEYAIKRIDEPFVLPSDDLREWAL
jgi:hypothetical protein